MPAHSEIKDYPRPDHGSIVNAPFEDAAWTVAETERSMNLRR